MAQAASGVGVTLSVGEIIACFFFGEVIASMWILVNALQLLVFFGIWKILLPELLKVVLTELKRVSWGEYIDDLDVGISISELIWGDSEDYETIPND